MKLNRKLVVACAITFIFFAVLVLVSWEEDFYALLRPRSIQVIFVFGILGSFFAGAVFYFLQAKREAETELEKSNRTYRSIIEESITWVWETDPSYAFTYSNQSSKNILGLDPRELLGKTMLSIATDPKKLTKEFEESVAKREAWNQKIWQAKKANGLLVWLESNGTPVFNKESTLIGFQGAERDVTERIAIEQAKNEFISMVSHELRTPLTSVIGALGLLKSNENLSGETKELLLLADRNAQRLTRIINDILDVEKIQLARLQLNLRSVFLSKVIQEALSASQNDALAQQVTLVEGDLLPDVQIYADYDRLIQILLNFLSNAIKFSLPGGEIIVRMEQKEKTCRVSVEDRGKGIPLEMEAKIFEKFTQGEMGDARHKGTGLGLSISKSLVEQMGGKIGFVSTPNVGSVFYFEFPVLEEKKS